LFCSLCFGFVNGLVETHHSTPFCELLSKRGVETPVE
jgi:hypothetical protein